VKYPRTTSVNFDSASGTTLDCDETLNLQDGDVLVAVVTWEDVVRTPSIAESAGGNQLTMFPTVYDTSINLLALGYLLDATADADAAMRFTLSDVAGYRHIAVLQYRPDEGDIVSLDTGPSGATGVSSNPTTGLITTTGDDVLVWTGSKNYAGRTITNAQIANLAADQTETDEATYVLAWTRLFNSAQTDIYADDTFNSADDWVCDIGAIKSVAAGGSKVPLIMVQMNQFGGGAR
jgi:hypothetical protein